MSELLITPVKSEIGMPSTKEALYLAALALADLVHSDPDDAVVNYHIHHFTPNPNEINNSRLLDSGELSTKTGYVYRPLSIDGLTDLIEGKIVRNEFSARAHTPRSSHNAVYWIEGSNDGYINVREQLVIVTKTEEIKNGWITPDKLTGIYTAAPNGLIENLLSED